MKPVRTFFSGVLVLWCLHLHAQNSAFQAGSFIVNMGVSPQTNFNALLPYGMVYDLVRNYNVPVYWIINPNKLKDGIDFSHNGIDYRGGPFIIANENRTTIINARIAYWQSQGVIGNTAVTSFTAPVGQVINVVPKWSLDQQSGDIAEKYILNAGIPVGAASYVQPYMLGACQDIFVLPHADPTWNIHQALRTWAQTFRGSIWASCHAVSVLENTFNPLNNAQQLNFLANNSAGPGSQALIPFGNHKDGSPLFNNNNFPADPVMQFIGSVDDATINGSEQIYLPAAGGGWRPTTKVLVNDPTHLNVPSASPGAAAVLVYGKAFGDNNRGWVMYQGGHSHDKGGEASIAAQRAFLNFSFMATFQKSMNLTVSGLSSVMISNTAYNLSVAVQQDVSSAPYTYQWSSSCGGSFSNAAGTATNFTPSLVITPTNCVITVKVTDACGRSRFQTFNTLVTSGPRPPVANADSLTFTPDCVNVNPVITFSPLSNDLEPDGQPLTITNVSGTNGVWSIQPDQTIRYTPTSGFYGTATGSYTVCDNTAPTAQCASTSLKAVITSAFTPPSAVDDSYIIYEDSITTFNVLANDLPVPASLKVAGISILPRNGKVSINPDQTITYLPNADYNGLDSFTYRISGSGGYMSTAVVRIRMAYDCCSPGNYKRILGPVITTTQNLIATEDNYIKLKAATTNYGTATELILDRESTDKHVGLVKFDISNLICYATLVRSATVRMQRTAGTDQPVSLYSLSNNWSENQATWNNRLTGTPWATAGGDYNSGQLLDQTGTPVSNIYNWSATSAVHNMVCSSFVYANNGFIIRVDATGGNRITNFASRENTTAGILKPTLQVTFDSAAFICAPIPVRPPLCMPDTASVLSNAMVQINAVSNDQLPGANTGTITVINPTVTTGTATVVNNQIQYIPSITFTGLTSFSYYVTDNITGLRDTALAYVYVSYPAPSANNDSSTIQSGGSAVINYFTNDVDPVGLGVTSAVLAGPRSGSYTLSGTTVTYTAPFNFYGRDTVTYILRNQTIGLCNEQPAADTGFMIIIVNNRVPLSNNDTTVTNSCQSIVIDVLRNDSDPENGSLQIHSIGAVNPLNAGTASTDGSFIYFTPNGGFTGNSASLTYITRDDAPLSGMSTPATITLNFQNTANNTPLSKNDTVSGIMNMMSYINVLVNDVEPDNDPVSVTIGGGLLMPIHGTIGVLSNGLISYTPAPGFSGSDVFDYRITDSRLGFTSGSCSNIGLSSVARVRIVIGGNFQVLPEFSVSLDGKKTVNGNELKWSVQTNADIQYFILERSADNLAFQIINTINFQKEKYQYTSTDKEPIEGNIYYRVKLITKNGETIITNTVKLYTNTNNIVVNSIFPVPFKDHFTMKLWSDKSEIVHISLMSGAGALAVRKTFSIKPGYNQLRIDGLTFLPEGAYIVHIQKGDDFKTFKLSKVH
jgi:hypothetical protein